MLNFLCNKKGITLLEVLISVLVLGVGILGLLTLFPSSWRLAARSDHLGRASGILLSELQSCEARLLNPSFTPTTADLLQTKDIYPSDPGRDDAARQNGDVPFVVNTRLADLGGGNAWLITVNVSWPGNATGISESLRVVRQQGFTQ
jgi:type II secretory pathway pseudopilin PulG